MNCKLSIIIPVYNAEQYVRRCVMSVMGLQARAFEVLLVNDGSADGSGKLCDELACRHENIKVFHKSNGGVVSARNLGLRAAQGKYITFIDADDWIRPEFLSEAVTWLEKDTGIDIVAGRMVRALSDGSLKSIFPKEQEGCVFGQEDAREALFKREYFGWELCGKIYRRELFDGWEMNEAIRICEDLDASWELFARADKVSYIPTYFYYYFWNQASATNGYHYLNSKSYLVFERILQSSEGVSTYINVVLTDHYIKSLVNLIRESYYQQREKKEIETYQQKLNAICSMAPDNCGQDVKAMCSGYHETLDYLEEFRQYIGKRFEEIYDGNKRVYYWGTGAVADYVSRVASQMGFDCNGYIVSEGELRKASFQGKKVLYLSDMEAEKTDAIILLVKRESQEVICRNLQSRGYQTVYKIDTMGVV